MTMETTIDDQPDSASLDASSESLGEVSPSTIVPDTAKVQVGAHLVISPNALMFVAPVGVPSSPITIEVANSGDSEIGPVTITITGANADDFTFTSTGCDHLAPLAACTIAVVWTPKFAVATFETATLVVTGPSPDFLTAAVSLAGGCLGKCGTGISAIDAGNAAMDGGTG